MRTATALTALALTLLATTPLRSAEVEKGTVAFKPLEDQGRLPERYRLDAHSFTYEMEPHTELAFSGADVYRVRFPSPFESKHPENNTIHAEYYRPKGPGPFPATVVLDITGGDQSVSRLISGHLARHGVAAFFMQMAYYGPRRPANSRLRMLTLDVNHSLTAVRQSVLDVRQSAAWLESRREVDARRIGVLGTSLGSFISGISGAMEPRLGRVVVLLGGGGLVDGFWDHPQAAPFRKTYEALGGKREKVQQMLAPVDPLTYADFLKARKMLIIAGSRDEIVPPKMATALWKASGEQKIVWYDCTHYGAALFVAPALEQVVAHFREP